MIVSCLLNVWLHCVCLCSRHLTIEHVLTVMHFNASYTTSRMFNFSSIEISFMSKLTILNLLFIDCVFDQLYAFPERKDS